MRVRKTPSKKSESTRVTRKLEPMARLPMVGDSQKVFGKSPVGCKIIPMTQSANAVRGQCLLLLCLPNLYECFSFLELNQKPSGKGGREM